MKRDREPRKVIVDTNALLIPGEFKVDIFHELQNMGYDHIIVPKAVLNELKALRRDSGSRLKGKEKKAANVAYSLLLRYKQQQPQPQQDRCRVQVMIGEEETKQKRNTDDMIVDMALKNNAAVLTNDANLRKRLLNMRVTTIYLRGRSKLEER